VTAQSIDPARCEELARRAVSGDGAARQELVELLWPFWIETARTSRSMGAFARSEDAVHSVAMTLLEKIGQADGRALALYGDWSRRHPDKDFADWMRIVTKNAIRDYVRDQMGPRPETGEISVKRLLNEFASSAAAETLGVRPPFTAAQTARELLEFAKASLPPEQLRVLDGWLQGARFEDMAIELGGSAEQARSLMRAAVATLRRRFGAAP
jgi:DNA-directed RNA polymerase specialized sigma24 family protein